MNFWKIFFASLAAIVFSSLVTLFFFISAGAGFMASFSTPPVTQPTNSVLYIDFGENVIDAPMKSPMSSIDIMNMNLSEPITLREVLTAIEKAATDSSIKGICIRIDGLGTVSAANIEEMRVAIERFKESGKFVVAYDDIYTQVEYYLASVADEVLLQPEGSLDWRGVSLTTMFYKGLIDKLDADVEIFRPSVCRYKSAVEPFFLTKMSKENRKQMEVIAHSIWQTICEDVAKSRNIGVESLQQMASNNVLVLSEDAVKYQLVDRLAYEDELYELFDSYGVERDAQGHHHKVTLGEYIMANDFSTVTVNVDNSYALEFIDKPLVAVIYAEGDIVDGDLYMDGQIYGTSLARELRQARLDERTKAVVVRVNSPGGSALASDVVWREMSLLQQTKPVVISMGDMAASGGYYISTPADAIYADRLTLTGSIGVFGMMLNLENTLRNKIGITVDVAATSAAAVAPTPFSPMSNQQREAIMKGVDRVYEVFTGKVAEGRNMDIEDVYNIAEGRVWTGSDAVNIGLVDNIGGFTEALSAAANLADLGNNFTIYEFTAPLTPFEEWMKGMGLMLSSSYGIDYNVYQHEINDIVTSAKRLIDMQGIQARVASDIDINM
ncbi:MAG: signal peptide peptidase SppA [Alistipes sp.]|nr:signal peptide peptidase SppA [Alistipes sp.]